MNIRTVERSNRRTHLLLGAAVLGALLLAATDGGAAELRKLRMGAGSSVLSPILAHNTVGQALGYYEQEGIDLEIVLGQGSAAGMQQLLSRQVDVSSATPGFLMKSALKAGSPDALTIGTFVNRIHWRVAVNPDSPVKTIAELRGKRIGALSLGDSSYLGIRAMLQEVGINPDADATLAITGFGAPSAIALRDGRIDAFAAYDGPFASLENLGFRFRYLPLTPGAEKLFGPGYATRRDFLAESRALAAHFLRAAYKGVVFTVHNPEAAVRIHMALYPESRPKGKTEDEALREMVRIVEARMDKWRVDDMPVKKFGYGYKDRWEAYARFEGIADKAGDVTRYYTNDLIDEANSFRQEDIIRQAKEMTPERVTQLLARRRH